MTEQPTPYAPDDRSMRERMLAGDMYIADDPELARESERAMQLMHAVNTMDPSDLNVASIAIGDMKMGQTIRRSVTNVGPAGTYTATVTPLEGMNIQVNPTTLTLGTGQTGHFDVTFTKTPQLGRVIRNAQGVITGSVLFLNAYQPGTIVWTDGTRNSRIPVTIRPQGVFVPTTLTGKIGEPLNANLTFGYDGPFAHSSVAAAVAGDERRHVNRVGPGHLDLVRVVALAGGVDPHLGHEVRAAGRIIGGGIERRALGVGHHENILVGPHPRRRCGSTRCRSR